MALAFGAGSGQKPGRPAGSWRELERTFTKMLLDAEGKEMLFCGGRKFSELVACKSLESGQVHLATLTVRRRGFASGPLMGAPGSACQREKGVAGLRAHGFQVGWEETSRARTVCSARGGFSE